ncbi:MAG: glycosyltransferase family 4 protein [Solirubrobacterales bacterium]|nr:glycosyltransferase family 4 protein [Solirubrobacterales bacterium]
MRTDVRRHVEKSSFIVLANGQPDSPPGSGLIDYLLSRGAHRLTAIFHPLTAEDGNRHLITEYVNGRQTQHRAVALPTRPPLTYPLDALFPPRLPPADGWFAFNNLLCMRGLLHRRLKRAATVVYWAVDFVPDRFGAGTVQTRTYDAVDGYCCRHADLRVELSQAALQGRDLRHGLSADEGAPRVIAPIGAWLDRVPTCPEDAWERRRIVFIGHLVERMGGDTVIQAAAALARRGVDFSVDIAGRGPLESELRAMASREGLEDRVRFHGFISDHRQLEALLAEAAIALAPYSTRVESFTRFADPSKLKSYLAAGLPILLTDVPPNAAELEREAGAEIVPDEPVAFADAIERLLAEPGHWGSRRGAALAYARQFDWTNIVATALTAAGFEP